VKPAPLLVLLLPGSLLGQAVVTGIVREDSTGRRLPGVDVIIEGTAQRAVTDETGRFALRLVPGGYVALFRLIGFAPVRLAVRVGELDTIFANASLVPSALPLPPLEVEAKPDGPRGLGLEAFEERRRMGFGRFIDSTVLRRSEHLSLADMLRRVQGVQLVALDDPRNIKHIAVSTRRFGLTWDGPTTCPMQIVLDGVVVYRTQAPVRIPARLPSGDPNPAVPIEAMHGPKPPYVEDWAIRNLVAIEVYRGASETPIEFGGPGAACGTIVLWTRQP